MTDRMTQQHKEQLVEMFFRQHGEQLVELFSRFTMAWADTD